MKRYPFPRGLLAIVLGATCCAAAETNLQGTVQNAAGEAVAGALVYAVGPGEHLPVRNNQVMDSTGVPRAMSGADGKFSLDIGHDVVDVLCVIGMDGRVAVHTVDSIGPQAIAMPAAGRITGRLLHGPEPVQGQDISAYWQSPSRHFQYVATARTRAGGEFSLNNLLPGVYRIEVREEVPQIGCCFRSVATVSESVTLESGQELAVQFGGTNLPYLCGRISDGDGAPLHGAWVSLTRPDSLRQWSAVTRQDGSYAVYDLPPGAYTMRCFRRVALNSGNILDVSRDLAIDAAAPVDPEVGLPKNTADVEVDLAPFLPLAQGQDAPAIQGTLTDGAILDPAAVQGKVVVLYFCASWCSICAGSVPRLNEIAARFVDAPVVFIAINLDKTRQDCDAFARETSLNWPQLYDGPWAGSTLRKAYRVENVPSSFVVGRDGVIAYVDVFGDHLAAAITALLD